MFLTGQIPTEPGAGDAAAIPLGIEAQTRRTMDNLVIVLEGLGLDLGHVVAARVFLTRFEEDYDAMNAVYRSCFPADRLPARTCIGVTALARGVRVEIDFHRAPAGELRRSLPPRAVRAQGAGGRPAERPFRGGDECGLKG